MRLRSVGRPRRGAVTGALLVLSAGWLTGCADGRPARDAGSPTTVRVLQLNLCNSGRAACYSGGRAVRVARALVSHERPHVVSLNEVCREDVEVLKQAMSASFHGAAVASAFKSAVVRPTMAAVRCRNGQEFGDGVLVVLPSSARGFRIHGGIYPVQDPHDVEERVWVCIESGSHHSYCSTHAASTDTTTALAQCRFFMSSAVQMTGPHNGGHPIIVAGDFNIAADGSPNLCSCLPRGFHRADDGAVQHVVSSPDLAVRSRSVIDMRGATDHPGLLAELVESPR